MSEFRDAIEWRGPGHFCFIIYGVWDLGTLDAVQIERTKAILRQLEPKSEVSSFVASDAGWPCEVGVFDVDLKTFPDPVEGICKAFLDAVCRGGARLSWMMFEGMFNDIADTISAEWAKHTYAIKGDCNMDRVDLAIDDTVRHSPDWQRIVGEHRERLLGIYPDLRSM